VFLQTKEKQQIELIYSVMHSEHESGFKFRGVFCKVKFFLIPAF